MFADANGAWDMVRKIKQSTRSTENPQPELNDTQKKEWNRYWSTLYDDDDEIGENQRIIVEPPDKEAIKYIVDHLPMRKAPGPDRLTAELLKYGTRTTWTMTVKLV